MILDKKSKINLIFLSIFAMIASMLTGVSIYVKNAYAAQTWNFNYTGGYQSFTAPAAGNYRLEVWGAQGGGTSNGPGGLGGYSAGNIYLSASQTIYVYVGGAGAGGGASFSDATAAGWNGGGPGFGGGAGGGGTDIRTTVNSSYSNRIIVAGGGGGTYSHCSTVGRGGNGGGYTGDSGVVSGCFTELASPGTQSSGGTSNGKGGNAANGSFGVGGGTATPYGPGGGGGWYGGGSAGWGTAAGGSGYIGGVSNGTMSTGVRSGNGYAIITQLTTPPTVSSTSATVNNNANSNSGTGNILNWNPITNESVTYSYTVTNSDTTYPFTNVTPTASAPPNFNCGGWSNSGNTIGVNSSYTYTRTCTPNKAFFQSVAGKTGTYPSMTATFNGQFNGSQQSPQGTPTTGAVEYIYTSTSNSESVALGTPNANSDSVVNLGDQVKFTTTITNTGTTTLNNIKLSSQLFSTHSDRVTTCTNLPLAPNALSTCTTTFIANSNDVASSPFGNNTTTITADATYLNDPISTGISLGTVSSGTLTAEIAKISLNSPAINITNDVAPTGLSAGDTVQLSVAAKNDGNVNLTNIIIKDQAGRSYTNTNSVIGPNGTLTYTTANYVFTTNDAKTTPYAETITATANSTSCTTSGCPTVTANTTLSSPVKIYKDTYSKNSLIGSITTDKYTTGSVDLGDAVTYTTVIVNNGSINWSNLTVTDDQGGTYTCTNNAPAINASSTCTLVVTATKSMLTGTSMTRNVTVKYTTALGNAITDTNYGSVTLNSIVPNKGMSVTITSNPNNTNPIPGNTTVTFTYTIKNTGNIDITNPKVTTNDGLSCTGVATVLAPGASTTCTATKVVK